MEDVTGLISAVLVIQRKLGTVHSECHTPERKREAPQKMLHTRDHRRSSAMSDSFPLATHRYRTSATVIQE